MTPIQRSGFLLTLSATLLGLAACRPSADPAGSAASSPAASAPSAPSTSAAPSKPVQAASTATDIWALGVTLHWALTGHGVYGPLPDDPLLGIRTVLTTPPSCSASLRPEDRAVIERCLAGGSQRWASAGELAAAIDALPRP